MENKILVTGGAGYIGSQVVRELLKKSFIPIVIDNLSTGFKEALPEGVSFYQGDIRDESNLKAIFVEHDIAAVIHLAAKMVVEESIHDPASYYDNNVNGTLNLLKICGQFKIKNLIFSSTSTVYGNSAVDGLFSEDSAVDPISPYGTSKLICEKLINEFVQQTRANSIILRYFNVAGAALDGSNGQRRKFSTHVVHRASEVATGKRDLMTIFGNDYPTIDGTCVRDYIYLEDIALIHCLALKKILNNQSAPINLTLNCGNGRGYSVQEVLKVFETVNSIKLPIKFEGRRLGDPHTLICASDQLQKILNWKPRAGHLNIICKTAYQWQLQMNQEFSYCLET